MLPTIRLATRVDEPEVQRVIKAVYDEYGFTWDPESYHADLYDLETHYDSQGHAFFVAEASGSIVGTVALECFPQIPGRIGETVCHEGRTRVCAATCSLERLYVHPGARGNGTGGKLIRFVLDQAMAAGHEWMELWSDKRFIDAHRLYERFGAQVVGERICDDPDVSPEWGLLMPVPQKSPDV